MTALSDFVQLDSRQASLVIDCTSNTPAIAYFGKRLNKQTSFDMLKLLLTRQEAKCAVIVEPPISLTPSMGQGFTGGPGIELNNDSNAWSIGAKLQKIEQLNSQEVRFESFDEARKLTLSHLIKLDEVSNVISASTTVKRPLGLIIAQHQQSLCPII
jgi:alpha-galactosidase